MALALMLSAVVLLTPTTTPRRIIRGVAIPVAAGSLTTKRSSAALPPEPASLPTGPAYTPSGTGSWHIIPAAGTPTIGTGAKELTYTIEIEDGVRDARFAAEVDEILADPRGWIGAEDISLRRVSASAPRPDFRISLTSPDTSRRPDLCGFAIPYETSCHLRDEHRVVINLARWVRGAHAFADDLAGYRRYAINHEVGHALGHGHLSCPADGALAPVMMQQTFGLSDSYLARLNGADPGSARNRDHAEHTCRPNPWVVTDETYVHYVPADRATNCAVPVRNESSLFAGACHP